MSPLRLSLVAAVVSATLTTAGFYWIHQSRTHEARRLKRANGALRLEALKRVQPPAVEAKRSLPAESAEPVLRAASQAIVAAPSSPVPRENYRNEGQATPLATLQTLAWACDRGDVEAVGKLIVIDEPARKKAEAFLAGMPAGARAQWKTVDEMAAAILTRNGMASPFPDAEVLATATVEPIAADRVRLRLPDTPKDRTEYQKTATGWKYAVTEAMADGYIARAAATAQNSR